MADAELIASCETMAATKGGDFIPARRRPEGGYDVRPIVPMGADPDPASIENDRVFFGGGNTPDDAMRDLLRNCAASGG